MFGSNFKSMFSALGVIQRETDYALDDVAFNYKDGDIDFGWFLKCTTAGKTGAKEIVIPADAMAP